VVRSREKLHPNATIFMGSPTLSQSGTSPIWHHFPVAGMLNLLQAKAASLAGDRAQRALVHRLLHAAAAPYFM